MWKPLLNRRVLKTLRGSSKGEAQRGQYLLAVGLGCYKWYQSQTLGDVPMRKLSPEERWTRGGVPVRTLGPERGVDWGVPHRLVKENECLLGRWPQKSGVDCEIPHLLERGMKHSL